MKNYLTSRNGLYQQTGKQKILTTDETLNLKPSTLLRKRIASGSAVDRAFWLLWSTQDKAPTLFLTNLDSRL